jgi:hypothetical protein
MTTQRLVLLSGLLLGTMGACTHDLDGTTDYELSGGFGGAHSSVHIDPSGAMTRIKPDGTKVSSQLTQEEFDALQLEIVQADFPMLEPTYGCGGCADDFVHTISVHVGGGFYSVTADDSATYPERLRPVIETLSTMSRAELDGN